MAARNPQLTGNVGLYYCCYRLSLLGWNVMPTARNARGVDIIAYSQDATKIRTIQVKSLSKRNPVPLGPTKDKIMGDFWVIVNKIDGAPRDGSQHLRPNPEAGPRPGSSGRKGGPHFSLAAADCL